jgi:hypothetical protein
MEGNKLGQIHGENLVYYLKGTTIQNNTPTVDLYWHVIRNIDIQSKINIFL